jgi:Flp pilus assembly protein TadB
VTHPEIDPVDHHRTTRQHAGEAMKNGANAVGIISVAFGVIALTVGLAAFATGHVVTGTVSVVVAIVVGAAGLAWLRHTHRQVRDAELRWHNTRSDAPAPPPSS